MKTKFTTLFVEINYLEYVFSVGKNDAHNKFNLIYNCTVPLQGIKDNAIIDFDLASTIIKKNIYLIEYKLNIIFKDVVLIINNFNCSFINLSGFKKLNGSQILKEDITYILNSLKSSISKIENKKTILHIFNSKYYLDKKKVENLPIGLFGDFYSHQLTFCLINNNYYKNLNNIFDKCNLKIKKILLKSFAEGSYISNKNDDIDTFYKIKINDNTSQIFYFENDTLKFEQIFNFGSNLVLRDIAKITSLNIKSVKKIIENIQFNKDISNDDLIEKELFKHENYIKIKKKLILEIVEARIQEFSELLIIKNINFRNFDKKKKIIFLEITNKSHFNQFKDIYNFFLSKNNNFVVKFLDEISAEKLLGNVTQIVHFGWKKEAIPITHDRKSLVAKFFDLIFD